LTAGELPDRLREVTPAWLTGVLRASGGVRRATVKSVDFERVGTFTNEVWRLRIAYDQEEPGAPLSLVIKRPAPGRRDRTGEDFASEVRFYRDIAARAPVRTPRFHFGDLESGRALLLLEDVVGIQPIHFGRGASPEHARLALEQLATFHAHWWDAVDELDWVPHLADAEVRASYARDYDRGWHSGREYFRSVCDPFTEIGDALVGRLAESLIPLAAPATLLHGDAHFENLPLVEERGEQRVLFLDWPGPRRGVAAFDVAVFMTMSFRVDGRRRDEEQLVSAHADAARAHGVRGWSDPWLDYRRGVLRRVAGIIEQAHTWDLDDPIARSSLQMVFERSATAAADLRVGELIA
jgi:hypothetical protein